MNDSMLLLPSSEFHTDLSVHEQLKQLQTEINNLKINNEILKTSGRDLLERAPQLINIPHPSNIVQETLIDMIQQQAKEIQRLRDKLEDEKSQCALAINELQLMWKEHLKKFVECSFELQKKFREEIHLLSSR